MAKKKKKPSKRVGHVRLTCPHCARIAKVQRPTSFQRSMPCPYCRIPISSELIVSIEAAGLE